MSKIDLRFTGNVFDLKVLLEGREIGLTFDGTSEWTRTLQNFTIEGKLDLVMQCKGLNGTKWKLEISVDDLGPKVYTGKINKGYSLVQDQISIPIKI